MFIVSPHKFFVNWDAALATHSFVENKNTCQNKLNSKMPWKMYLRVRALVGERCLEDAEHLNISGSLVVVGRPSKYSIKHKYSFEL